MPWNRKTTRRDRKRRNTPRCRGLNRVHVVHFNDAERVVDRLCYRAVRWPVRCIVCGRIIHHSPIFSWANSLSGGPFVSGGPALWLDSWGTLKLSRRQRKRFAAYIDQSPRTKKRETLDDFYQRLIVEIFDDPPTRHPISEIRELHDIVANALEPKNP